MNTTVSVTDGLRVVVVADDHLARAGLAALLADQIGCTVTGHVTTPAYVSAGPNAYVSDVAVWDLGWGPDTGADLLAKVQESGVPTVVLAPDASHASEAWAAGARGVLPRDVDGATLMGALVAVSRGLAVLDPELASGLFTPDSDESVSPALGELTPRETQVLGLIADGLPNKTIAVRLDISEHTVKFHVNAILGKLGAQSRTEAVTRATRMGLIIL